jgi:hypothetical protein
MKLIGPLSDPEVARRKLLEIANGVERVQDSRIHIEKINGPFLFDLKGTPHQYSAGLARPGCSSQTQPQSLHWKQIIRKARK